MKRQLAAALLTVAGAFAGVITASEASAVTLYDPSLGTLPSAQGWSTAGFGSFVQSVSGGVYTLDTTAALNGGSFQSQPGLLDTAEGFTLDFGLKIVSETHAADNLRAGFSVIFTGADPRQSLELGFWQDEVFAYTAGFVPGTAKSFDTTVATDYSLVVGNGKYSLLAGGNALLSGSLVDYTARAIFPYTTPGVLFFGDDTSRGQSISQMGAVSLSVSAVPEPSTFAMIIAGIAAIAWKGRRRKND